MGGIVRWDDIDLFVLLAQKSEPFRARSRLVIALIERYRVLCSAGARLDSAFDVTFPCAAAVTTSILDSPVKEPAG